MRCMSKRCPLIDIISFVTWANMKRQRHDPRPRCLTTRKCVRIWYHIRLATDLANVVGVQSVYVFEKCASINELLCCDWNTLPFGHSLLQGSNSGARQDIFIGLIGAIQHANDYCCHLFHISCYRNGHRKKGLRGRVDVPLNLFIFVAPQNAQGEQGELMSWLLRVWAWVGCLNYYWLEAARGRQKKA